jgi:hypothetical protein
MTDLADELEIPIPTLMAWCQRGWVEARKVNAPDPRWAVWADEEEKGRMRRLAGGRGSGLRYPYPPELTTPKRCRAKKGRSRR